MNNDYFTSQISFTLHYIIHINTPMQNIQLDQIFKSKNNIKTHIFTHYQPATNNLFIIEDTHIHHYEYRQKQNHFQRIKTLGPIDQFANGEILVLQELVDDESLFMACTDGSIFTVDKAGTVDIKAQNEDGLCAASVSPTQQYFYFVTNNKTILQLNRQFDLVNEVPLDQQEEATISKPKFSWRTDGNFFVLCYETINGSKAVTKDNMMNDFISAAKSDPNKDGLVQSVSQKGNSNMKEIVAWQPSGSIVAGVDEIKVGEHLRRRVILWQKNGLRHLQFTLPQNVQKVTQLFWSLDSSILFVRVINDSKEHKLFLYYRANYHWFLKNVITIKQGDSCSVLSSRRSKHRLVIVSSNEFSLYEFTVKLPLKQWKNEEKQKIFKSQFYYFIDGKIVNISDLSKCLMPPPLSMIKANFDAYVLAVAKKENFLLIITEKNINLYNCQTNKTQFSHALGILTNKEIHNNRLISFNPIIFTNGKEQYQIINGQITLKSQHAIFETNYKVQQGEGPAQFNIRYQNEQLYLNDNIVSQQCTSVILYHEFLIFTVSTSDMYDKLYVINLILDHWIYDEERKIKSHLKDLQTKSLLNHRLVERGSRIVSICEGRLVFQLPRGNLEGIYPKIIMINLVKKYITNKQYKIAFQIVRTHKLDFNLLFDINPQQFDTDTENFLKDIKRVDYINLFVSHISDNVTSELQYVFSNKEFQSFKDTFELTLKGRKVKHVCRLVSQTLRRVNKQQYILSIFTSQIKEGKLNQVLFEIKELKANDVQVLVPPHLVKNQQKKKGKRLSAQQILEYVCWLVDANAIYEAALLTYDLDLAAMTARCTQKDPKQYLPYIENLKLIQNKIEFRKKICLDLKKYEVAVRQLSQGNTEQIKQSLQLIEKHKLYKHGLKIYNNKPQLFKVKEFIINELLITGQLAEAYKVCQSVGLNEKALQIAISSTDTKKIIESIQIVYKSKEERQQQVLKILNSFKDQIKNKLQLGRLYVYVGQYEQAVTIYLRHNFYRKAFQYYCNVSQQYRTNEMLQGFKLCFSIKKNDIIKDRKQFMEKYTRLLKVHKHKEQFGEIVNFKPRQNDDMYSEVSVSSKTQSHSSYTISTTTGMRKKKDKKRSILSRNVKEGSVLEEQYILAYIKMLQQKIDQSVKDAKLLIQYLICVNLIDEAQNLRNEVKEYIEMFRKYKVRSYAKVKFQQAHPEAAELYYEQKLIYSLSIDSFNYLF